MTEFALIDRIRARSRRRDDIVLGIGDDAALLQPGAGEQLVVTMDTLNDGVHFPSESTPADIGWKTLAVNLSDLAAMGARPAWCTLSLSLPQVDPAWIDGFADGFFALADLHDIALVGGDTTRGPLSLSVTAMGLAAAGNALRRDGARVGDDVWVTGTLGDAAAALQAWLAGTLDVTRTASAALEPLRQRLQRPTPRVQAGRRLVGLASAAVDISDGLLADLGHLCARSGVGAQLRLDALPASAALRAACVDDAARWQLQASGGDDYELCFTAAPQHRAVVEQALQFAEVAASRIGRIVAGDGVHALAADGSPWQPPRSGYQHFSAG
jgi:thiamine-monophosphate kinase